MQFSDEPKRCHHTETCDNEGTIFRDCTRGPMYDPRWFCEDHIEEADAVQHRISADAQIAYQRSVVENLKKKLKDEKAELRALVTERRKHPTTKVGDRFIYTHNGSYVEVTEIVTGRWPHAVLRFVEGGEMFNSECNLHDLEENLYGWWKRTV